MIKIYGVPNCKHCKETIDLLKDLNIEFEYINLKDPKEREARQLYRSLNIKTAPVVINEDEDGVKWILGTYNKTVLMLLINAL